MRIVLAAEAIKPPLTGIGRYAWELAARLPEHQAVQSVRYLAHGHWKTLDELAKSLSWEKDGSADGISKGKRFYRCLARSRLVGSIYGFLAPKLTGLRVNPREVDLFHGPNYFVPDLDVPCVVTIHDLSTFINPAWHLAHRAVRINRLITKSIACAKIVITDSQSTRREVMNYFGLPENRVVAVPLGVDTAFRPRNAGDLRFPLARYGLQPGGYCLCVSTIEPRKNILRLISAYRGLPAAIRNNWPLVLVGEPGWNSAAIHDAVKQAAREGWLKYLGFVPQSLLPLLYAGCRLFVYPSLYEGFGLPVAEAMASGVPVLTSNRSSMPEVAGGAAMLVEPEDDEAIRDGLLAAIEDELWRAEAVSSGLRRAAELSWEACVAKTVEVYGMALKKSK
ncbi:hypothetical protein P378_01460 [Desulforamulus profundi]|uniref:Glycosyl transferase family 1 n=1 Tax=Desulforamulus profundi TaxID=1383067 RepID=A0A2C6L4D1_9FIRM|nr:glycosyltransferase family 1 protein [Desulforamulus profundi]PHJ39761.1 hypothetical protein P378_01460 [Desulforamulus profundi]